MHPLYVSLMRRIFHYPIIAGLLLILFGCSPKVLEHSEANILKWADTAERIPHKGSVHAIQLSAETYIAFSTTKLLVKDGKFLYDGQEHLGSGFYIYPGEVKVQSIDQGITEAKKIAKRLNSK